MNEIIMVLTMKMNRRRKRDSVDWACMSGKKGGEEAEKGCLRASGKQRTEKRKKGRKRGA